MGRTIRDLRCPSGSKARLRLLRSPSVGGGDESRHRAGVGRRAGHRTRLRVVNRVQRRVGLLMGNASRAVSVEARCALSRSASLGTGRKNCASRFATVPSLPSVTLLSPSGPSTPAHGNPQASANQSRRERRRPWPRVGSFEPAAEGAEAEREGPVGNTCRAGAHR